MSAQKIRLIVHGGAWDIPDAQIPAHLAGVEAAVQQGWQKLSAGGSALDVVEHAVRTLEADSTFDAGRGAFLNSQGKIELDAMIMNGRNLNFGSVAAVPNILHPVSLARRLMQSEEYRMLVGQGALAFARAEGFEILDPQELLTERELAFYHSIKDKTDFRSHHPFGAYPSDTVGAVALDKDGNLAAATSTGGTPRKWPGRVGDSPIPGAGAYADNETGAASTTGWGESIMKVLLAKQVTDRFRQGLNPQQAAREAIAYLGQRVQGLGGVIAIHANGQYAWAHNTPKMAFAYMDMNQQKVVSHIEVKA